VAAGHRGRQPYGGEGGLLMRVRALESSCAAAAAAPLLGMGRREPPKKGARAISTANLWLFDLCIITEKDGLRFRLPGFLSGYAWNSTSRGTRL